MGTRANHDRVRYLAAAAAAGAAILYLLIGFEVLYIGESASEEAVDLFGFGLSAGITFAVTAVLLLLIDRRLVWIPAGLLSAAVIGSLYLTLRHPVAARSGARPMRPAEHLR